MGDRWTLELLLTAAPWISGNRTAEDKYLSTYIGALEMLMKGCTACYDLTVEFPSPTPEGLGACAKAYADAGMRAVVAPMVASLSFYQAIVGLQKYGKTPTVHLQDLGLLGPDFVAAHGVWLDDDDIARLADHGASVAHNPGSNMLLGNGIAAVRTMLDKQLNVGIGTDG